MKHDDDICSTGESNFVIRHYYDIKDNQCYHFNFDLECSSSGNVFQTKRECENLCKKSITQDEVDQISWAAY